jgi:hypothetical protein
MQLLMSWSANKVNAMLTRALLRLVRRRLATSHKNNHSLRGGFGTPEEGFRQIWKHSHISRRALSYGETVYQLEARMESNCFRKSPPPNKGTGWCYAALTACAGL